MKRVNNLYPQIYSLENLQLADSIARKGKMDQYGVKVHILHQEANILHLQQQLIDKTYRTSAYKHKTIVENKVREISILPYFPDRIAHHAAMNILEPVFTACFTSDTYSCIKGKGIHAALEALKIALTDIPGTWYCLKLDIKKFYPSIDHAILKQLLARKFKDADLLQFLFEIIDSAPGVPIGNYLSQYFANFYLTYFDHWLKEQKRVKYYFRYADDLVILSDNKPQLHQLLADITSYLHQQLKLTVKQNYQVFPVDARSIDFVGYRFYHTHILLRKSIKKNFARKMKRNPNRASLASYMGWAKHCNSRNLIKKLTYDNQNLQSAKHQVKKPDRR